MMVNKSKIKLVFSKPLTLNAEWVVPTVLEYFDLVPWQPGIDTKNAVYYTSGFDPQDARGDEFEKVIVDNLREWPMAKTFRGHLMECQDWYWYHESLWYRYRNYHTYQPQRTHQYLALMPMRLRRDYRDALLAELDPVLDRILWSYVAYGKTLPDDKMSLDLADRRHERLFRPQWYDSTDFSIVAESRVRGTYAHLSEKTYKAIAYYHPFLILGVPGLLARLRYLGFETFDNIFDESYDAEPNWKKRLMMIKNQVCAWNAQVHTPETQRRLIHNHNHFFNKELVISRIKTEVLEPLLHYAAT